MVNLYAMFQIREAVSRSQMFFKIGVLKNFENFTRKHLCWSLFLIKLQDCNFIKEAPHRFFPVKFAKSLRTHFSTEHLRWLLLKSKKFLIFSVFLYNYEAFCLKHVAYNPNFILFKWRWKRKHSPAKCSSVYFAKENKW